MFQEYQKKKPNKIIEEHSMTKDKVHNVVIIGSGPAGLTAAIYTARAQLEPIVLHGHQPGGQLTTTTMIENYPGFENGVDANDLVHTMIKQAESFGAEIRWNTVESVSLAEDAEGSDKAPVYVLNLVGGEMLLTRAVIVATGARPRKLGLDLEDEIIDVRTCATCDGYLYRGKEVAIIGGGDSAVEEAIYLSRLASKVYLVHRRDELRASKVMAQRALENPKIEILWNRVVDSYVAEETATGSKKLKKLRLRSTVDSNDVMDLEVPGVFLAIGHIPNSDVFRKFVKTDKDGYIVPQPPGTTHTSSPGIFVAGDVADHRYRQAVTAAGSGCQAAIDAERYLATI